jgi:hypothetical protein
MSGAPHLDAQGRVNLNTAPRKLLTSLPGVSSRTARRLVARRPLLGRADLLAAGLSAETADALRPHTVPLQLDSSARGHGAAAPQPASSAAAGAGAGAAGAGAVGLGSPALAGGGAADHGAAPAALQTAQLATSNMVAGAEAHVAAGCVLPPPRFDGNHFCFVYIDCVFYFIIIIIIYIFFCRAIDCVVSRLRLGVFALIDRSSHDVSAMTSHSVGAAASKCLLPWIGYVCVPRLATVVCMHARK